MNSPYFSSHSTPAFRMTWCHQFLNLSRFQKYELGGFSTVSAAAFLISAQSMTSHPFASLLSSYIVVFSLMLSSLWVYILKISHYSGLVRFLEGINFNALFNLQIYQNPDMCDLLNVIVCGIILESKTHNNYPYLSQGTS